MLKPLINKVSQMSSGNIDPINQNIKFCDWLITHIHNHPINSDNINEILESLTPEYIRYIQNKTESENVQPKLKDYDEVKLLLNRAFMFFKSIYIDKNYYLKKKYSEFTKDADAFKCLCDNVDKLTESINDKLYFELEESKASFINSKQSMIASISTSGAHWIMFTMKDQCEKTISKVFEKFEKAHKSGLNKKDSANVVKAWIVKELSKLEQKNNFKPNEVKIYQPWMRDRLVSLANSVVDYLSNKKAPSKQEVLDFFNKDFTIPLMPLYYAYSRYNTKLWKENDENRTKTFEVLMQEYIDMVKINPSIEKNMIDNEAENINMFKDKYYSLNMLKSRTDCSEIKVGALNKIVIGGKSYLSLNFPSIKWKNPKLVQEIAKCLDPVYFENQINQINKTFKTLNTTDSNYKFYKELVEHESEAILFCITNKLKNNFPIESSFLGQKNLPTLVEWFYNMTKLMSAKTNDINIIKNLFGKYNNNDDDLKSYSETEKRWVPIQYDFSNGQLLINTQLNSDGSPHFTATGYKADGIELIEIGKDKNGKSLYHLELIEPAVYLDPYKFKKEELYSNISHILNCLPIGVNLSQIKSLGITSATIMNKEQAEILDQAAKASFTGEEYIKELENSIHYLAEHKGIKIQENEIMNFILNTPMYHHTVSPTEWIKDPNITHLQKICKKYKYKEKDTEPIPVDSKAEEWKESLKKQQPKSNWSPMKQRYYKYLKTLEQDQEKKEFVLK